MGKCFTTSGYDKFMNNKYVGSITDDSVVICVEVIDTKKQSQQKLFQQRLFDQKIPQQISTFY